MNSHRKMTPKGQMSGNGSGPAIMMMPDQIRSTFMPDPPIKHLRPPKSKRPKAYEDNNATIHNVKQELDHVKQEQPHEPSSTATKLKVKNGFGITGVAAYMAQFERGPNLPPKRVIKSTPIAFKEAKAKKRLEQWKEANQPLVEQYRAEQRECAGEYMNMNCYSTLFVGRLTYEVTERKLLREFEAYGPVKDIKIVTYKNGEKEGKSCGYAFVEFEQENDMKRAYRAADGIRVEGKEIVVDVERGHTGVPNWLPRRLGGGLGGTRLGAKSKNYTRSGRFDPSNPPAPPSQPSGPPSGYGQGPPGYGHAPRGGDRGGYGGGGDRGGYGGGGDRGGYGGDRNRGGPGGYGRGPEPPRGGGGGYGPPRDRYGGGPPQGHYDRGAPRGGGYNNDRYGDRGMKRERSRSPGRRDSRRSRY